MSATDFPPRCKDKNNLAKNVQCELIFLQKYVFFSIFADLAQKKCTKDVHFLNVVSMASVLQHRQIENEKWKMMI